jgi:hypothetical protein
LGKIIFNAEGMTCPKTRGVPSQPPHWRMETYQTKTNPKYSNIGIGDANTPYTTYYYTKESQWITPSSKRYEISSCVHVWHC